jgi:hypothetical protein
MRDMLIQTLVNFAHDLGELFAGIFRRSAPPKFLREGLDAAEQILLARHSRNLVA